MKNKTRHLLGISGGKDSAALAIYMRDKYPQLEMEYYCCDTGKELDETYQLIENLNSYLGKPIKQLIAKDAIGSDQDPFDHFFKMYRGYLPSSVARWCTKKMKLEPFENFVGNDLCVSYVGIRGDEEREGYISKKANIQSIFPFRKNIWSTDVLQKAWSKKGKPILRAFYSNHAQGSRLDDYVQLINQTIETEKDLKHIVNELLNKDVPLFNRAIFTVLKEFKVPLSFEDDFPMLDNEDVIIKEGVFKILKESGVGVPAYYNKVTYKIGGEEGAYARSRSGCYFCFFQQKIEWIWLYEQHPDLFAKARTYENDQEGFTWNQHESLDDIIQPNRMKVIKSEYLKKEQKRKQAAKSNSPYLMDILDDGDDVGCTACFV